MALWRAGRFAARRLPAALQDKMACLLGSFQKAYSLAVQSFRMREIAGFQQDSVQFLASFWPVGEGC